MVYIELMCTMPEAGRLKLLERKRELGIAAEVTEAATS